MKVYVLNLRIIWLGLFRLFDFRVTYVKLKSFRCKCFIEVYNSSSWFLILIVNSCKFIDSQQIAYFYRKVLSEFSKYYYLFLSPALLAKLIAKWVFLSVWDTTQLAYLCDLTHFIAEQFFVITHCMILSLIATKFKYSVKTFATKKADFSMNLFQFLEKKFYFKDSLILFVIL